MIGNSITHRPSGHVSFRVPNGVYAEFKGTRDQLDAEIRRLASGNARDRGRAKSLCRQYKLRTKDYLP